MIAKTSNLIYRLDVQVTAYGRQTVPDKGVVTSRDPLKYLGSTIISLERLNLKSSNFVQFLVDVKLIFKYSQRNFYLIVVCYARITTEIKCFS